MKFGKTFEQALQEEGIPDEWKSAAIKYKRLKKCINKVDDELQSLGLSTEAVKDLLDHSARRQTEMASINYVFDGTTRSIRPKIRFRIGAGGTQIDELSAETRIALKTLLDRAAAETAAQRRRSSQSSGETDSDARPPTDYDSASEAKPRPVYNPVTEDLVAEGEIEAAMASVHFTERRPSSSGRRLEVKFKPELEESDADGEQTQTLQIKLGSDLEFFEMLSAEVGELDDLHAREKDHLMKGIETLGDRVATLVRPAGSRPSDVEQLYAWREILKLWEEAGIFEPKSEQARLKHTPERAAERLHWFITELDRRKSVVATYSSAPTIGGIVISHSGGGNLHSTSSGAARRRAQASAQLLQTFAGLNVAILRQMKFQSMNAAAMGKILKKFDKRTGLVVRQSFPRFMRDDPFFADGARRLASAVYAAVARNLLSVVPQLDDYECPICTGITVKPVRLSCGHVFCVRCLVTLQAQRERHCPMCRADNVLHADSTNIDHALLNFLKMYFPREARDKQHQNERQALEEQVRAAGLDSQKCILM